MLKVPYHRQRNSYTCGPASLQMVFEFFKVPETQKHLSKAAHTNDAVGTLHEAMISLARQHGFYCYVHNNSNMAEIEHFVANGLPVIIDFLEPTSDEGHYAVVVGLTPEQITFNDPWNGRHWQLTRAEFDKRWHDATRGQPRWIMVLNSGPFAVGKQFAPKI